MLSDALTAIMQFNEPLKTARPMFRRAASGLAVAAFAIICFTTNLANSATPGITGPATVTDGDTIKINNTRVRLHGIDAPEAKQTCEMPDKTIPCGTIATDTLRSLIKGHTVTCKRTDTDRYGRVIAICRANGHDIGQSMVHAGWAVAYRRYSKDYVADENDARAAKRGMWRGRFVMPWEWRRGVRLSSGKPPPQTGCLIKGNISKSGKIYHLPGSRWYDATVIDEVKGERWFCSVGDAVAAGWRAVR